MVAELKSDSLLTAKQVADILAISPRTVYTLPVECYYIGTSRRWEYSDILEYKNSCRSAKKVEGSDLRLTASSPGIESELASYFRKAGLSKKQMPTNERKRHASTHLRLVKNKTEP